MAFAQLKTRLSSSASSPSSIRPPQFEEYRPLSAGTDSLSWSIEALETAAATTSPVPTCPRLALRSDAMAARAPASAPAVALSPPLHRKMLLITPGTAEALALSCIHGKLVQIAMRDAESRRAWKVYYHIPERVFFSGWPKLVRTQQCAASIPYQ